MKRKYIYNWMLLLSAILFSCKNQQSESFTPIQVYKSNDLIVIQITKNAFVHTSYKQTNDFGNVPCNGLIVTDDGEAIIFDTPTNDKSSLELIKWIKEKLQCKINAIVPTHFHDDCLGGLKAFDENNIPSYAYYKTIELAKENNYTIPKNGFTDSIILKMGNEHVIAKFFGEGHTKDNIVGYYPAECVLFGGCLIKELKANKGYLGDAIINQWSATVSKVKKNYLSVELVVPGHGSFGNKELLDYTINLFKIHSFGENQLTQ